MVVVKLLRWCEQRQNQHIRSYNNATATTTAAAPSPLVEVEVIACTDEFFKMAATLKPPVWTSENDAKIVLPGGRQWRPTGSGDRFWSPGRFHALDAGRAACGWAIRWISGSDEFLEGQRYLACNDEASWHHQLMEHSCERPAIISNKFARLFTRSFDSISRNFLISFGENLMTKLTF